MTSQAKIYVADHSGMVGSANHALFLAEKPNDVYLAATKLGGIFANNPYSAEFICSNLMVEANVIDALEPTKTLLRCQDRGHPAHAEPDQCWLTGGHHNRRARPNNCQGCGIPGRY